MHLHPSQPADVTTSAAMTHTQQHRYAWLMVIMSCLFLFYKYIAQVSPSVMTDDLMQHFHLHATSLATLIASYFPAYLITQMLAGPMLDRYSVRKLSTYAIIVISMGLYVFSQADTLWQAYMGRACMGAGAAFATVSYLKLAANWFSDNEFAYVAGWLATAASLGGMMAQTPIAYAVTHIGWQTTLSLCALLGIVLAAAYSLFVKDHHPNKQQTKNNHHDRITLCDTLQLLKSKKVWALAIYSGLAWAPMSVFTGLWGDAFLQTAYHLSKTSAANLIVVSFVGLAVGGPTFGWFAKRCSKPFAVMGCGCSIALLGLSYTIFIPTSHLFVVSVALFFFGFGTGAFMLGFAVGKRWFNLALAATVVALINSGDALFGAITEPFIGHLLDLYWNGHMHAGSPLYTLSNYQDALSALPMLLCAALLALYYLARQESSISDQ